jgi:hypothetical protein
MKLIKICIIIASVLLVGCQSTWPEDGYFKPTVAFINYCENMISQRDWYECIRREQIRGIVQEVKYW